MTRRIFFIGGLITLASVALFSCVTEEIISTTNIDGTELERKEKVDSIQQVKMPKTTKPKTLYPPGTPKSEREKGNG